MQTERSSEEPSIDESTVEDPAYRSARKRAEELQGFYVHLLVYIAVNTGFFVLNLFTRADHGGWWFYWPLTGWGIGLTIHALVTFGGLFSEDWKDRKASELYDRARHDR
jgi:2TM domain